MSLQANQNTVLKIPSEFDSGKATGGGDCFFDSVKQGLQQLKPDERFTIKELRKLCKRLAVDNNLKQSIIDDAKQVPLRGDINDDDLWNAYLARIEHTSEDIAEMKDDELTSSKYGRTLEAPIWGRPEIEGKLICEQYNVKLHIVKNLPIRGWSDQLITTSGSNSVASQEYWKENTIHIKNAGNNHFEPILRRQEETSSTMSQTYSNVENVDQSNSLNSSTPINAKRYSNKQNRKPSGLLTSYHGVVYQVQWLMLVALEAENTSKLGFKFKRTIDFQTEDPHAGKFDDVVWRYETDKPNSYEYNFLQAKHKLKSEEVKITQGDLLNKDKDFSLMDQAHDLMKSKQGFLRSDKKDNRPFALEKYFLSYRDEILKNYGGQVNKIIIATNIDFDDDIKASFEPIPDNLSILENIDGVGPQNFKFADGSLSMKQEVMWQLRRTYESVQLVEELLRNVLNSIPIDEESSLGQYFFDLIASKVIDQTGKFHAEFINNSLQGKGKTIYNLFYELGFENKKKHRPFNLPNPEDIAKKIGPKTNKQKGAKITRGKPDRREIVDTNIDHLENYVFVRNNKNEIIFSKVFWEDKEMSDSFKKFRQTLQEMFVKHKFIDQNDNFLQIYEKLSRSYPVTITGKNAKTGKVFSTCEEYLSSEKAFWETIAAYDKFKVNERLKIIDFAKTGLAITGHVVGGNKFDDNFKKGANLSEEAEKCRNFLLASDFENIIKNSSKYSILSQTAKLDGQNKSEATGADPSKREKLQTRKETARKEAFLESMEGENIVRNVIKTLKGKMFPAKCSDEINSEINSFLDSLTFVVKYDQDTLEKCIKEKCHWFTKFENDFSAYEFKSKVADALNLGKDKYISTAEEVRRFFEEAKSNLNSIQLHGLTLLHKAQINKYGVQFEKECVDKMFKCKGDGYNNPKEFLNSDIKILNLTTEYTDLTSVKVNQAIQSILPLESDKFIFMALKNVKQMIELVLSAFEKRDLLIITCGCSDPNLELYGSLKEKLVGKKKIILVSKTSHCLAAEFQKDFTDKFVVKHDDDNFKWSDLTEKSQQAMLKRQVTFQGQEMFLGELIDKSDEKAIAIIDSAMICELIQDLPVEIGREVRDLCSARDYFVERDFDLYRHEMVETERIKDNSSDVFIVTGISRDKTSVFRLQSPSSGYTFDKILYKLKIIMYLAKDSLEKQYGFWLGSHTIEPEKFGDVLFKYYNNAKTIYSLWQVELRRPKDKKLKVSDFIGEESGQFNLKKCFTSFRKMSLTRQSLSNQNAFIMCTNAGFDTSLFKKIGLTFDKIENNDDFFPLKKWTQSISYRLRIRKNGKVYNELMGSTYDFQVQQFCKNVILMVDMPSALQLDEVLKAQSSETFHILQDFVFSWMKKPEGTLFRHTDVPQQAVVNIPRFNGLQQPTLHFCPDKECRFNKNYVSQCLYQHCLLMLFLKRVVDKQFRNFCLAKDITKAKDFGDVVFKYENIVNKTKKSKTLFLMARHSLSPLQGDVTLEDLILKTDQCGFNMKTYFDSYRNIKSQFGPDDFELIFYTNDFPSFTTNCKNVKKVVVNEDDVLNTEIKSKSYFYQIKLGGNMDSEIRAVFDSSVGDGDINDFLSKLKLFFGQPNEVALDSIIRAKFGDTFHKFQDLVFNQMPCLIDPSVEQFSNFFESKVCNNLVQMIGDVNVSDRKPFQFLVSPETCPGEWNQIFKRYLMEYNIHLLDGKENYLVWKKSQGSLSELREILDDKIFTEYKSTQLPEKVSIIAAEPGMGKTTTFTHLAEQVKLENPDQWVIFVELANHKQHLSQLKLDKTGENWLNQAVEFISVIENVNSSSSRVTRNLLDYRIQNQGKIVLFFDGFDELSDDRTSDGDLSDCQAILVNLMAAFNSDGKKVDKIWVSTRLDMKNFLEDKLSAFAYRLKTFTKSDQKEFLERFWQNEFKLDKMQYELSLFKSRVNGFTKHLLARLAQSTSNREIEVLGIPLLTRIVAEAFIDKFKDFHSCLKMPVANPISENINLVELYRLFVERKYEIYFKKIKIDSSVKLVPKRWIEESLTKNYRILAYQYLYHTSNQEKESEKGGKKKETKTLFGNKRIPHDVVKELKVVGIIHLSRNSDYSFIHRTFAEYFCADYLAHQMSKEEDTLLYENVLAFLKRNYFRDGNETFRCFYDRLTSKTSLGHEAALNNKKSILMQSLGGDPNKVDALGRTALHLAAGYNHVECAEILLESKAEVNALDHLCKWSPLTYAVHSGSLEIVDLLLRYKANEDGIKKLYSGVNTKSANKRVKPLLCHIVSRFSDIDAISLLKYLQNKGLKHQDRDKDGKTQLHYAVEGGKIKLVKFIAWKVPKKYILEVLGSNSIDPDIKQFLEKVLKVPHRVRIRTKANSPNSEIKTNASPDVPRM